LIRLYLEIQNRYAQYWKDDPLTEEDLHTIYFTEPNQPLIKPAPDLGLPRSTLQKPSNTKIIEFNAIKGAGGNYIKKTARRRFFNLGFCF
jgi:hypothetical protein